MDINEVSPTRICRTAFERRSNFLGEHHLKRVATDSNHAVDQTRDSNLLRRWPNGIADIDVHVESNRSSRKRSSERDSNSAVTIFLADGLGGSADGIELHAILK
jgi:hypothetical protein